MNRFLLMLILNIALYTDLRSQCSYERSYYFQANKAKHKERLLTRFGLLEKLEDRSKLNVLPSLGITVTPAGIGPIMSWNPSSLLINRNRKAQIKYRQFEAELISDQQILSDSVEILKIFHSIDSELKSLRMSQELDSIKIKIDYLKNLNPLDSLLLKPSDFLNHQSLKDESVLKTHSVLTRIQHFCIDLLKFL